MAGAMRRMGVYLGLLEDTDRYEDDEYVDDHETVDEHDDRAADLRPTRNERPSQGASVASLSDRRRPQRTPSPRPTPQTEVVTEMSRITTLHPRNYNEARTIGEHFRDGTPVIMNLTEMDDDDAKRLVDFSAGLVFGVHGTIERVTNKVFLLSPPNVSVAAEDKQRIAEGGFFNQS